MKRQTDQTTDARGPDADGSAARGPHADRVPGTRAGARGRGRAKLPLIGAQISTAGGFAPVPGRAMDIGAEAVQIFSSNPRTWRTRPADAEEMAALTAGLREHRLPLFFHTIYLINLASPDDELRRRSALSVAHALATGALAGAAGVVTHVGSHRGQGFTAAVDGVVQAVRAAETAALSALAAQAEAGSPATLLTPPPPLPPLLLENSAGAGSLVGNRLDELAALLGALAPTAAPRAAVYGPAPQSTGEPDPEQRPAAGRAGGPARLPLGICLDTAHLFAAGYPVHEPAGLEALLEELRELDLLRKVGLIHLNDSATPFASNRDRHADPGEGLIGFEGLATVVRHPALAHIPFVLEVPGADGHGPDAANLAVVRSMRAGAQAPPRAPAPGARRRAG